MANKIATVAQIRDLENSIFAKENSFAIMILAANAVAKHCQNTKQKIIVIAGKGNNGGDGIIVAKILKDHKKSVEVCLPFGAPKKDIDAFHAYELAKKKKVKMHLNQLIIPKDCLIVDALYGIGLKQKLNKAGIAIIEKINQSNNEVIAVDLPSGLSADTGAINPIAVRAKRTISFFTHKPGLLMRDAKDYTGEVIIEDLGYTHEVNKLNSEVIDKVISANKLQRKADSHKGKNGSVAIMGGNDSMQGALVLATRAAVLHGAGKVFAVSVAKQPLSLDIINPEIMYTTKLPKDITAVAIGVGLGTEKQTKLLTEVLKQKIPLVIDADGLNYFAKIKDMQELIAKRKSPTILTPHPAEAARLLNITTAKVQDDRLVAAKKLAKKFNATILLKGAGSVIVEKEKWAIVAAGNPSLAQAGSGDVLTGMITALLAQSMTAWEATANGAYLHAKAADVLVDEHGGEIGISLDEIMQVAANILSNEVSKSCFH